MRITFYLDKPKRSTSSLLMNVAFAGRRMRVATGVVLEPEHWNHDRQTVRSSDPGRNAHQKRLEAITTFVQKAYNEVTPSGDVSVLSDEVVRAFEEKIRAFLSPQSPGRRTDMSTLSFDEAFGEFIDTYTVRTPQGMITSKRPGRGMLSLYSLVRKDLKEWSGRQGLELNFEMINDEFYQSFYAWLSQERGLIDSTIANHIKTIKVFMKWSRQKGLHNTSAWEHFWYDGRTGETIALTRDELLRIRDLDLSDNPKLMNARDLFLLQTYTGMRYGDLCKLSAKHFDDAAGVIRYTSGKTNTKCVAPLTKPLKALLKRIPDSEFTCPFNVEMNIYLKKIGQLAGLDQKEVVSYYQAGQRHEETFERWQLLTTHVARRTFVSLSIRFGASEAVISRVTGHAAKGMLQKHYIVLDEETVRDLICTAWEKL
ncbi:MAG: tyrosine-type recombinase/integrase [Ignavibacteria bacterium]|nr:tyrosine-type recombinase/integrase [Ignavibacteria bacterium]MBK9182064.1 tyrosine-type recombinase/integrase [Ignavibacteria bacterium]